MDNKTKTSSAGGVQPTSGTTHLDAAGPAAPAPAVVGGDARVTPVKPGSQGQNLQKQDQPAPSNNQTQNPKNGGSSGNVKAVLLLMFALLIIAKLPRIMAFYRPQPRYCCGIIPI